MIGILDSALGGLDLVRRLTAVPPRERFIYFGDTAHGAYDEKSPEAILRFARRGARFLEEKGVRRIVVACGAIACAAGRALAAQSAVPVTDAVDPAAAAAVRISPGRRIGVIGGRAAILSGTYTGRIHALAPEAAVYETACPLVAAMIEEGWLKKPETAMIIKKYLIPLKARKIDTLILADGRYSMTAKIIQRKIGPRVHLIAAAAELAASLPAALQPEKTPEPPTASGRTDPDSGPPANQTEFYLTDITPDILRRAAVFLKRRVRFLPVD